MTPAQLLAVAVALGGALLVSEGLLSALRLNRVRVGFGAWMGGIIALVVAAYWADHNTGYPADKIHLAAVAVAAVLTCLWFNDPKPVRRRRPAPATRPPEAGEAGEAGEATCAPNRPAAEVRPQPVGQVARACT